jgi:hypothetical protein
MRSICHEMCKCVCMCACIDRASIFVVAGLPALRVCVFWGGCRTRARRAWRGRRADVGAAAARQRRFGARRRRFGTRHQKPFARLLACPHHTRLVCVVRCSAARRRATAHRRARRPARAPWPRGCRCAPRPVQRARRCAPPAGASRRASPPLSRRRLARARRPSSPWALAATAPTPRRAASRSARAARAARGARRRRGGAWLPPRARAEAAATDPFGWTTRPRPTGRRARGRTST